MDRYELERNARCGDAPRWIEALISLASNEECFLSRNNGVSMELSQKWSALNPFDAEGGDVDEQQDFALRLARRCGLVAVSKQRLRVTRRGARFGTDVVADSLEMIRVFTESLRWIPRPYPGYRPRFFEARILEMTGDLVLGIAADGERATGVGLLVDDAMERLLQQWIFRYPDKARARLHRSIVQCLLKPLEWLGAVWLAEQEAEHGHREIEIYSSTALLTAYATEAEERNRDHAMRPVTIAMGASSAQELLQSCVSANLDSDELAQAARAYRDVHGEETAAELVALAKDAEDRIVEVHFLLKALPWIETLDALMRFGAGLGPLVLEALRPLANEHDTDFVGFQSSVESSARLLAWRALGWARRGHKRYAATLIGQADEPQQLTAIAMLGESKHPRAKTVLNAIADSCPYLACAALTALHPLPPLPPLSPLPPLPPRHLRSV